MTISIGFVKSIMKLFLLFVLILGSTYSSVTNAKNTEFVFQTAEESFHYSVIQTGENYTFKFKTNPNGNTEKLNAGYHVLQSIYKDNSINKKHTESYIRERARCFMFDSHFYTYSLCFLPNDFNKQKKDRFWGFVTQVPNGKWLLTRILLPVLLAFALLFYVESTQ